MVIGTILTKVINPQSLSMSIKPQVLAFLKRKNVYLTILPFNEKPFTSNLPMGEVTHVIP